MNTSTSKLNTLLWFCITHSLFEATELKNIKLKWEFPPKPN